MNIGQVLSKMGYTEFTCTDTYESIVWIVEPETIPSKEEVLDMVSQLDDLEQAEQDAKATAKESALTKLQALGLTEEEINSILGL
jgi:hypothetical protein